jgi:hypothetical protein
MVKPKKRSALGEWEGDGPQGPSPTVVCAVEHNPALCSFPMCDCAAPSDVAAHATLGALLSDAVNTIVANSPITDGVTDDVSISRMYMDGDEFMVEAIDPADVIADDVADTAMRLNEALGGERIDGCPMAVCTGSDKRPTVNPTAYTKPRAPKRDRAKYMRSYRAQKRAPRTQ